MMKVLHVVPGLSPRFGGPTRAALEMCQELSRRGTEATLVASDCDVQGNLPVKCGEPVEIHGTRVLFFRSPGLRKYGFSPALSRWLWQNAKDFDIVHFHGLFSTALLSTIRAARRWQIPYIIRPLGQLSRWSLRQRRLIKRAYLMLVGRSCLEGAAFVHVTSQAEQNEVEHLGWNLRPWVIPLGHRAPQEGSLPERGEFKRRYRIPDEKKLVVFLSRLHQKKGLDCLIPALAKLVDGRNDITAVIAGSGDHAYVSSIKKKVVSHGLNGAVIFPGFLQGGAKLSLLKDADVFVLPSYDENFGYSVVEAMEMGVPVVVSRHVGISPDIAEGNAGIVIDCDASQIECAVRQLINDPPLRDRMGACAKRVVQDRFSWDHVVRKLNELYSTSLGTVPDL